MREDRWATHLHREPIDVETSELLRRTWLYRGTEVGDEFNDLTPYFLEDSDRESALAKSNS